MRKRQAEREAKLLLGSGSHLDSYPCRKKGCRHEGCTGPLPGARRRHYRVGCHQEASALLAKSFVVKGEGFSWHDAIEKARA